MEEQILKVEGINFSYGNSKTLMDLTFFMDKKDILAVIGRNGVGKTTLLKCLMGINKVNNGQILFYGENGITTPCKLSRKGMAYVPQGREIFPHFSVLENLQIAAIDLKEKELNNRIEYILEYFPALHPHLQRPGGVLSGGQQQQLAIARALMTKPRLLLLDEPTEGIQPNVVSEIAGILKKIHGEMQLPIIVVEQNLKFVNRLCSKFICMQKGKIAESGRMEELTEDVIQKYLMV